MENIESSPSTTAASLFGEDCAEHPPLSQSKLCDSFMEVGSLLFSACPDLFSNALTQLSNQLSLALVKNPDVLRSKIPAATSLKSCETSAACCGECCQTEQPEVDKQQKTNKDKQANKERSKHVPFRKYVLPKDAPPEYYQCMDCGERRPENSFQNDHMHLGKKPKVRWYCPLCKCFFAVTHRSGHIKCKHPSSEASSPASSPSCPSPDSCATKRYERCESIAVSSASSPREEPALATATKETLVMTTEEGEEEGFGIPVQKRACLPSTSSYETTPLFSSSEPAVAPVEEGVCAPVVRVPSTPAMFGTYTSSTMPSGCSDEVLPAFRYPSYVLMPEDTPCTSADPSGSGYVLFV